MQVFDGLGDFVGGDVGTAWIHVDVDFGEECLVEDFAGAFTGEPVDLAGFVEQVEQDFDGFASGVDLRVVGGGELTLEAFTVVADLAEPRGDLFFGPAGVADEVEVPVFLPVQFRNPGSEWFA